MLTLISKFHSGVLEMKSLEVFLLSALLLLEDYAARQMCECLYCTSHFSFGGSYWISQLVIEFDAFS